MQKNRESVIKFGRTSRIYKRFVVYPSNSTLLFLCKVKNCKLLENNILSLFKQKFKNEKQYGREYFSGNINIMVNEIEKLINETHQKLEYTNINGCKRRYQTHINFKLDEHKISNNVLNSVLSGYLMYSNKYDSKLKKDPSLSYNDEINELDGHN